MTTAQLKRRVPRRWALFGALAAIMLVGGTVLAVHDATGPMELDGNIADNPAGGPADWGSVFDASGNQTAGVPAGTLDTTGVIKDFVPGASGPDVSHHEPSNKDDQAIDPDGGGEVWGCVSVANPTDKTDIVNAYGMAVQGDAQTGDGDTADDQLFYFGVERFDNSGDAFIGLWLFQDDVSCTADGKFVGSKQTGDILVLANFTGGGSTATIQLFSYTAGAGTSAGTFDDLVTVTGKCENTNTGDLPFPQNDICATLNDTNDVDTPWAMEDKVKPGPPTPDVAKRLEPDQFVEGGVNLTDIFVGAGLGAPPCFGSFLAETRSSSSLDATLKDYALGDLQFCDARVKIDASATNRVGTQHTFVVDVEQQLGAGYVAAPTGNVDVTLTGSNGITAGDITIVGAASTCDDNQPSGDNLDAAGQCTLTVNSLKTGKITANATVAVDVGGSPLIRDTDPATLTVSGYTPDSGPAVKTYVDATIDIAGDDSNRVGDPHEFTVTVKKDIGDGNGFVAAANQVVAVTLTPTFGATPVADDTPDTDSTCDDGTNASGQCKVKFTSATTGVVTGTAATTVSFAGGSLSFGITSANDNATVGGEDATKVFVDATIDIEGDDANRVGDPHEFTVTVKKDLGDGAGFVNAVGQIVTVTLTDTNGAAAVVDDTPDTDSTCDDGTNASGQCKVKFTSASTGITTGTASTTVSFGNGLSFVITTANDASVVGNEDATKKWVNARIGIAGTDTNSIEEDHTFTVTLQKDLSANGGYVAANGEQVSVTLVDAVGAVHILDTTATTCDVPAESHDGIGTDSNGQCVVVFTSNSAGTVTGSATATLTVETVQMTVNTGDATSTTAATVVKTFIDGSIRWLKHDGDGALLGGASFEVCRTHRLDSSDGSYDPEDVDLIEAGNQPFCFTVFDDFDGTATAPDVDDTAGEIQVNDLVLGTYTVRETIPPAGYHIQDPPGAGPFTFPNMTILAPDVELGTIFVNIKAFRIIVITCDDITDLLVDGTVNLDPAGDFDDTKETISATDFTALGWKDSDGTPLTQTDFCNQGGASFGDLPDDTYDATIEVPDHDPVFPDLP